MTPNCRKLLELCIETGITYGYARAYKHADKPDERLIQESIEREIWSQIDEFFDWQQEVQ
jgi:hypothetical protein